MPPAGPETDEAAAYFQWNGWSDWLSLKVFNQNAVWAGIPFQLLLTWHPHRSALPTVTYLMWHVLAVRVSQTSTSGGLSHPAFLHLEQVDDTHVDSPHPPVTVLLPVLHLTRHPGLEGISDHRLLLPVLQSTAWAHQAAVLHTVLSVNYPGIQKTHSTASTCPAVLPSSQTSTACALSSAARPSPSLCFNNPGMQMFQSTASTCLTASLPCNCLCPLQSCHRKTNPNPAWEATILGIFGLP